MILFFTRPAVEAREDLIFTGRSITGQVDPLLIDRFMCLFRFNGVCKQDYFFEHHYISRQYIPHALLPIMRG